METMKKIADIVLFLLLLHPIIYAQEFRPIKREFKYEKTENKEEGFIEATYYNGRGAMLQYLGMRIHYPELARQQNISGEVVASFVVGEDGTISDIKIVKGIGRGCDEQVKYVIASMPKWKPARYNNKNMSMMIVIHVLFKLI